MLRGEYLQKRTAEALPEFLRKNCNLQCGTLSMEFRKPTRPAHAAAREAHLHCPSLRGRGLWLPETYAQQYAPARGGQTANRYHCESIQRASSTESTGCELPPLVHSDSAQVGGPIRRIPDQR